MIYKKYNETSDEKNNYYLKIKGKLYDRNYTLSVIPFEQEKGSAFESALAYTGCTVTLVRPARWTAKREALYDSLVEEYSDRIADSFTRGAQAQKEATPADRNYVYSISKDEETLTLLKEVKARSATI